MGNARWLLPRWGEHCVGDLVLRYLCIQPAAKEEASSVYEDVTSHFSHHVRRT